ncbi:ABC-type nitrate sulfonate bicarbonate transport [Seminavis robusta]|uniref:ABC-type nitrate sulfonate bicarbonate transport n=1 Tax=Seminavis robusta TaxID=568900 RepID=A0A9N8DNT5_9STRA|nr:ABC-type nitrate sulfonate bicarbonate transport [Seminavis robusta]|eukprot:Sro158_g071470.1 ABC-type nitrate sulfonate bicarbonate transport (754) ;mRNA; r:18152-20871
MLFCRGLSFPLTGTAVLLSLLVSSAVARDSVTIGYLTDLVAVAHQIAIDKNYYEDLDLDVEMVWYPSGDAMITDVNGTWDIGSAGVVSNILGSQREGFLGVGISMDASATNQLVGTQAAVETWPPESIAGNVCVLPDSTEQFVVESCLKSQGYAIEDVSFIYARDGDCLDALTTSTADLGGFSPPGLWELLETLEGSETICSGASVYATVANGHMVRSDFALASPMVVAKVLAGWLRAVNFINTQDNFKETMLYMSSFYGDRSLEAPSAASLGLELRLVGLFGLQLQLDLMERRGEPPLSNYDIWTNEVGAFLLDKGAILTQVDPTKYITDEFLIMINEDEFLKDWATGGMPTLASGCSNVPGWADRDGDGCDFYEVEDVRCLSYGNIPGDDNMTANDACCTCGGGTQQCTDVDGWEDIGGDGCSWYASDDRCEQFGDFASFAGIDGTTASEACCVCGGGSSGGSGSPTQEEVGGPIGFCEDISNSWCDIYADGDCCLQDCSAEIMAAAVCHTFVVTGEDNSDCPVPSCPSSGSPVLGTKQFADFFDLDLIEFVWRGVQFNAEALQDNCPDEWNGLVQCVIQDCPNFIEVCPDIELTTEEEETPAPIDPVLDDVPTCAQIEQDYCGVLEENPDCCVDDCLAEVHLATTCVILEETGEDRSDCQVPTCTSSMATKGSGSSTAKQAGGFIVQYGGYSYSSDTAVEKCPDEWASMFRCLINSCPNIIDVCPDVFSEQVPTTKKTKSWIPGGLQFWP